MNKILGTTLKTNADFESVRQAYDGKRDKPDPAWVRGICPQCGDTVIANAYYLGGKYLITHECWSSFGENPTCEYRKMS